MSFARLSWPVVFVISLVASLLVASPCLAQWTKTIDCPDGTEYRDVRIDAGREEFCELLLPGSLKVQDGPSRWWYSQGHFGEEGNYSKGRKVGKWKECDRFDRCQERAYELISPEEKARRQTRCTGVVCERQVRVRLWFVLVNLGDAPNTGLVRKLNFGSGLIRCQVTYIPSTEKDRPAGNQGHYLCEFPTPWGFARSTRWT